jgi:hypothetical protein
VGERQLGVLGMKASSKVIPQRMKMAAFCAWLGQSSQRVVQTSPSNLSGVLSAWFSWYCCLTCRATISSFSHWWWMDIERQAALKINLLLDCW